MDARFALCVLTLAMSCVLGCRREAIEEIRPSADRPAPAGETPTVAGWPWWRGPSGENHAAGEARPPLTWSRGENVRWSVPLPGAGHASPIVVEDRIFLATAEEAAGTQSLLCLATDDGRLLWQRELHRGKLNAKHQKNSHASATPACDGERVLVPFSFEGSLWVSAVDLAGELLWQTELGPHDAQHGFGSSPCVWGPLVIVLGDSRPEGFLAGIDRASGEIAWRVSRRMGSSYGSPAVLRVAGEEQVITSAKQQVAAYHPATGELLWTGRGPAGTTANTPAEAAGLILVTGGYPQRSIMALRADGSGEVAWEQPFKLYVPSPLVVGDSLVALLDNGVARCFSLADGGERWTRRLRGDFSASPLYVAGRVLAINEAGVGFVLDPAQGEILAENDLAERVLASPVALGESLYVRTEGHLFRIGPAAAE